MGGWAADSKCDEGSGGMIRHQHPTSNLPHFPLTLPGGPEPSVGSVHIARLLCAAVPRADGS
jgi:hypothetical protein